MSHFIPTRFFLGWLFCFAVVSFSASAQMAEKPLVIGAISHNAKKHIEAAQPLADYLAMHLKSFGYTHGQVVVARNVDEMAELLRTGRVDLVSDTIFSALELQEKAEAKPFLRRWKKGVGVYSSLVFARQDSGLETLDDLKGKVIAFEDRESTSGYFLPASLLLKRGYELVELSSPGAEVPAGKIGYVFAKEMLKTADEISISSWVYRGVVDAGALSSVNWNDDKDLPEQFRTEFTVLDESMPFPRSILLIRPGMSEQLTSALKMLLINAEWEALGQIALKAYQRTRRFDELNDSVQMAQQLADMLRDILQTGLSDSGQSAP